MNRKWKRALSLVCTLAMLAGMLPVSTLAAATTQPVSTGINGYSATMQADGDTSGGWADAFVATDSGAVNISGTNRSAALNGKIWADKSVSIGENGVFDVTFSALGQTYAGQSSSQSQIAFDVVFVVDVSNSMAYTIIKGGNNAPTPNDPKDSRMNATVDALNAAADALLVGNGYNRIAVVPFSGSVENNDVIPLANYSKSGDTFFSHRTEYNWFSDKTVSNGFSFSASSFSKDVSLSGYTNPQAGILRALEILRDSGTPAGQENIPRTKVIILLTDGEPNQSSREFTGNNQPTTNGNDHYYNTVCSAAYAKEQLNAKIYTIGLGITAGTDAAVMLDPSSRSKYPNGDLARKLDSTIIPGSAFTSYDYADASYTDVVDSDELERIFDSIISSLGSLGVNTDVGEATGGRNQITYEDNLDEGVVLAGSTMTLTVPTYNVGEDSITAGDTRVYTLTNQNGTYVPTSVAVGGRTAQALDAANNPYDAAALNKLSVTVTENLGKYQVSASIPPELMAYNVFIAQTKNDATQYSYFENTTPLKLEYSVKLSDNADAGEYMAGDPGYTFVRFFPSSQEVSEGVYDMPYYWPNGLGNSGEVVSKTGTGVEGASSYVSSSVVGTNNDVTIYLGNNGRYVLTGQDLTVHLFWDDAGNQDGKRPENVTLTISADGVSMDPVILTPANLVTINGQSAWQYVLEDQKLATYTATISYTAVDNAAYEDTVANISGHTNGTKSGNVYTFANNELDLKLSHTPETIQYTINKVWSSDIATADQPNYVTVQLYGNGKLVQVDGQDNIQITASDGWTKTLTLDKYNKGVEVSYTVVEDTDDYTPVVTYDGNTATITNYPDQNKTTYTVVKTWDDANDQDGKRPTSVSVTLTATTADGNTLAAYDLGLTTLDVTLSNDNGWRHTWTELPKTTSSGAAITYSVSEDVTSLPDGYTANVDDESAPGYAFITNTHNPETVSFTINKVWQDDDNQDGIRPRSISGSISGSLSGNSKTVWDFVITANDKWSTTINGLPKYSGGQLIKYGISENAIYGYDLISVDGTTPGVFTLTNKHTPQTVNYTVNLTWDDDNNAAGQRPSTVTVNVGSTSVELTVNNDGSFTAEGYTITENNGVYTLTINDLPMYTKNDQGQTIPAYYTGTVALPGGSSYEAKMSALGSNTITYKLSYTGDTTYGGLGFTKEWAGNYTYLGVDMRPSPADYAANYLTLYAVGNSTPISANPTISDNGNGTYTVTYTGLEQYANGAAITYQVVESPVQNFQITESNTVTLTEAKDNKLINTFTLTPPSENPENPVNTYGEITVTKTWIDADMPNARPEAPTGGSADPLNIQLYLDTDGRHANGLKPDSIVDNGNGTWTYTWSAGKVLKTDLNGNNIDYVVYEKGSVNGYTLTSGQSSYVTDNGSEKTGVTITNTYTGETATGTLTISKVWSVDNVYEETVPTSQQFVIYGEYDGTNSTYETSQIVTLSAAGNWTNNFTLPLTVNGQQVTYTVKEIDVPTGYMASTPAGVTLNSTEPTTVTVTNTYNPDSWTLTYNATGGTGAPKDDNTYSATDPTATVKDKGEMTYEGYTFLGWDDEIHGVVTSAAGEPNQMYQANDQYILTGSTTLYAVWAVDKNENGIPDYMEKQITVNVIWNDDDDNCGIRPDEIGITLVTGTDANGDPVTEDYDIDLSDPDGLLVTTAYDNTQWIYTVPDLFPMTTEFTEASLTDVTVVAGTHADPDDTNGYTSEVTFDSTTNTYTITLTHDSNGAGSGDGTIPSEKTSYTVTKSWNMGSYTGTATATLELYANGVATSKTEAISGDGTVTWNNLDKYAHGELINYTAVETKIVDGNGADITGKFAVEYGNGTITNTYTENQNVTVIYTWDDDANAYGIRPNSVTVGVFYTATVTDAEGATSEQEFEAGTLELGGNADVWYGTLSLDESERNYYVRVIKVGNDEVDLDSEDTELANTGYDLSFTTIYGDSIFLLNSAYDNNTARFTVTKTWTDDNNAYGTRPDYIWVSLMQGDTVYSSVQLNDTWTYTWNNLPKLDEYGDEFVYSVDEQAVPGYNKKLGDNGAITNSLDALDNPGNHQLTVTYVFNNGQANETEKVNFNGFATGRTPTAWAEHSFEGWYIASDFTGTPYDFTNTHVTQDITLYAKWVSLHDKDGDGNPDKDEDDHHYVTFVYVNASAKDGSGNAIAEKTQIEVNCHSNFTFTAAANSGYILNVPTKTGSAMLSSDGNNTFTLRDITGDVTVVITATRQNISTGGGGGGSSRPSTSEPELNKEDHIAYVSGYPDGTVRPNNLITREEVATIFFRLLTDESRARYITEYNPYPDVEADRWSYYAITTLTNGGIMTGRTDGTFDPAANITRGEFAVVAAQFSNARYTGPDQFSDISAHWSREYVNRAAYEGWTTGYPDGTYGPDRYITRAEVMALINEVLERTPNADYMLDDMKVWPDNPTTAWFYADVQEATNSHTYVERTETELDEHWIEITDMRTYNEMVRDAFNAKD